MNASRSPTSIRWNRVKYSNRRWEFRAAERLISEHPNQDGSGQNILWWRSHEADDSVKQDRVSAHVFC